MNAFDWIIKNIQTQHATGGFLPFPDHDFLRRLVGGMSDNRILMVAKSRQMMATWTALAWTMYLAFHEEPGIYLLLSKGQRDSRELMKRIGIMAGRLPAGLSAGISVLGEEARLGNGSRMITLPASEYAARMYSPALVLWDEMAFTPNDEEIWAGVKPSVDSGGRFIGISTPNGADNLFHNIYADESNGFGKHRLHYSESPDRDPEWEATSRKGLSAARWRQEYEIDFNILADRVYDEFDLNTHIESSFVIPVGGGNIYRGIDFGYHHPYVVWLHEAYDGRMTIFAEWEGQNAVLEQVIAAIRAVDERLGISERDVAWSGCDPAGAAANDSGMSSVQRMREQGFKLLYRSSEIMTGVEFIKSLLKDAAGFVRLRLTTDCDHTIYHMRHYRWDEKLEKPDKDGIHDHGMDALRYLIVNLRGREKS